MRHKLTLAQIAGSCAAHGGQPLPLPPEGASDAVFDAPWQAHAFGLTLLLHERGVFTWPQWAEALARQIRHANEAGAADDGSTYYTHWLNTLEHLVVEHRLGTPEQIHALEHAWEAAAARTPHGQPIHLGPGDTDGL